MNQTENIDLILRYINLNAKHFNRKVVSSYEIYSFVDRNFIPRERKYIRVENLDKIINEYL